MKTLKNIMLFILAGILLLIVTVFVYGQYYFKSHFLPGTIINHLDCSFKTENEVYQILSNDISTYSMALHTRNGGMEVITGREAGMSIQRSDKIHILMHEQNHFLWFLPRKKQIFVDLPIETNTKALNKRIRSLRCMNHMTPPTDAYISYNEDGFYVFEETEGNLLDQKYLFSVIDTSMRLRKESLDIENYYVKPLITATGDDLYRKCSELNQLTATIITYDFGTRKETVEIDLIQSFLTDYTLDERKVYAYVSALADTYDTVGKERTFITYDNREKIISGGDYGWAIDIEKETSQLFDLIQNGEIKIHEPAYKNSASDRSQNDIGYSYLEIDQTNKKIVLYCEGTPVVEAPIEINMLLKEGCYTLKKEQSETGVNRIIGGNNTIIISSGQTKETSSQMMNVRIEVLAFNKTFEYAIEGIPIIVYS